MNATYLVSSLDNVTVKLSPLFPVLSECLAITHMFTENFREVRSAFLKFEVCWQLPTEGFQKIEGYLKQADQQCLRSFICVEWVKRRSYEKVAYLGVSGRKTCEARQ
jgi:hypothetical protein